MPPSLLDIDARILREAADWLVLLQSGEATAEDRRELSGWQQRSPAHAAAWQRAEQLLTTFRGVPARLAHDTLDRAQNLGRRRMLRGLGAVAVAAPLAWCGWRYAHRHEWNATLQAATGEQRRFKLADGSRIILNTATLVDVAFTATERSITLRKGEILIATGHDPAGRPLVVHTAHGRLRALGTRFAVRLHPGDTRLVVTEGAVEIRTRASTAPTRAVVLHAGQQTTFDALQVLPTEPADAAALLWERGMLLARDLRLDRLAAELARYHTGTLVADAAVAGLVVSGAFPVTRMDDSLALLEKTLPVRVQRTAAGAITLLPR